MAPQCRVPARPSTRCCAPLCRVFFLKSSGCDPKWLVPLGCSLCESWELGEVVCRSVAWTEDCLVNRLTGVECELLTVEEERTQELVQDGNRTDGWVVEW